jgi:hypothetical protein
MKRQKALLIDIYGDKTTVLDYKEKDDDLYFIDPNIDEDIYIKVERCMIAEIKDL